MIATGRELSTAAPFVAYAYSYPHKSAYRRLTPSMPLHAVWQDEAHDSLLLYLHVPFCEYRCGFCNLFTLANVAGDLPDAYLRQLRREAEAVRSVLPAARFARIAIGGGTPTFLAEGQLTQLLQIAELTGASPHKAPVSCEASPATLTPGKARLLRQWGVDRLSLGVQSFDDVEARRVGRPQRAAEVRRAIDIVRDCGFPVLNLDLIYGIPDQSVRDWMHSLEEALRFRPEELYLYPLYVRELTGLGKISAAPSDNRLQLYRSARRRLLEAGYEQVSLRMFRLPVVEDAATPAYCCQSDGMLGLGCGARSYTRQVHYSTEYAVGRTGVRSILLDYLSRQQDDFRTVSYGYRLNAEDQQRRFVIQSLLQAPGLSLAEYRGRFGSAALGDLPQLVELVQRGLARLGAERLVLSEAGQELSDAIGPWLYADRVRSLMETFECR